MEHIVLTLKNLPEIGDILRDIRVEKQVSQQTVADKMNANQSFISGLESTKIIPTLPSLVKYLKVLNGRVIIVID